MCLFKVRHGTIRLNIGDGGLNSLNLQQQPPELKSRELHGEPSLS